MQQSAARRKSTALAFLPALLAIGVTAVVASGASLISSATASTSVAVSGSVSSSFSTSPGATGGAGATGCADETIASFASAFARSNGCEVSFSSNNFTGSELVFENQATGVGQSEAFFCSDGITGAGGTRSCAVDSGRVDDLPAGAPTTIADGSDTFGIALMAVNDVAEGTAVGSDMAAVDSDPQGTDSVWVGIPANGAPKQLCAMGGSNSGTSTCQFAFGGSGEGGAQGAGDYTGTLSLTAALT